MAKEPKRYECRDCGFISNRTRSIKFPNMIFATCYRCGGRLVEREEWLEWLHQNRVETLR
jgi:hypothetical protein